MKPSAGNLAKLYQYSSQAISAETRAAGLFDNDESIDYKGAGTACLYSSQNNGFIDLGIKLLVIHCVGDTFFPPVRE